MKKEITLNEAIVSVKIKGEYYDSLNDAHLEDMCDKISKALGYLFQPDIIRQVLEQEGLDLTKLIIRIQG